MFVIEDELHAEHQGEFESLTDVMKELERRARIPWDQPPNVAPCTNWRNCGRCYEVVEYDKTESSWSERRRFKALEVSADGVCWDDSIPNR